jgi:hypothetical protein
VLTLVNLIQINESLGGGHNVEQNQEPNMTGSSDQNTAGSQSNDATTLSASANKSALHFMMGTQTAVLQEILFAGFEMFDRTRTELHLFAEYAAKVSTAHSVGDIRTVWAESSRHQLEFVRRDCDRLLKHGEQMIETASKLLSDQPRN